MIYLRKNTKLRELERKLGRQFGCLEGCSAGLISVDEYNLLIILLREKEIEQISEEQAEKYKGDCEHVYFHSTHICKTKLESDEDTQIEEPVRERVFHNEKSVFTPKPAFTYSKTKTKQESIGKQVKEVENSVSFGLNLVFSLFFVAYGAYCFCSSFLEMNEEQSLIVTVIVSVIALIAEALLVIIKLSKETVVEVEDSFAFKFNRKYRVSQMIARQKARKQKKD